MSTEVETDTTTLSELDFIPKCSVGEMVGTQVELCNAEAKYYIVVMRCIEHEYGGLLACNKHFMRTKRIDDGLGSTWCETCNAASPYLKEYRRI